MIKELIKIANSLDAKGLQKEADSLDRIITAIAYSKKQLDTFDQGDNDGKPFEDVDFKALESDALDEEIGGCPSCGDSPCSCDSCPKCKKEKEKCDC